MINSHLSGRSAALIVVGIVAAIVVGLAVVAIYQVEKNLTPTPVAEVVEETREAELAPSLDCAFRPFITRSNAFYFYFDVDYAQGKTPLFYERALVSADGSRKRYAGDERPVWTYAINEDGKSTIKSADGTLIVLYGLKLGAPGIVPVEAGIRSTVLRNLGGECRQTNLDGLPH
ncbi:hypothetical protein APY04_3104 [Hyphomicrobium sulfonivorans]|uniref:Uncharacterized protein n=1 Tax=Hyphomicrobium sulfonivorans TaxID=121290 RepID=A0A109B9V8_HYPSL|nr:hypothetical protein [Hyphomicrobium sulfonivorans]KWT64864.1 hypothetical protein APY04_3104 [Hyphomicrobium sulfonivorans]